MMRAWTAGIIGAAVLLAGSVGAAQDRVYVSTFLGGGNGTIYEIDFAALTATRVVGGFNLAEDIVCKESTDQLFICESLSSVVLQYDLMGGTLSNVIPTAGAVDGPEGPSISPSGDLYLNTRGAPIAASGVWMVPGADPTNAVVNVVGTFSGFGEGSAFGRAGISAGGLLAVDRTNGRVILSNPPGAPPVPLIVGLATPFGIAVNSLGEIFVADRPFMAPGRVDRWAPDGTPMGNLITNLIGPTFIEVDSADNVIIADVFRVLLVDPSGAIIANVPLDNVHGVAICRAAVQIPCIDIKPGSDPNSINIRNRGLVPVAVLGSSTTDVMDIDPSSVRFGPDSAPAAHQVLIHFSDVNGDGFTDAVFHFRTRLTGIQHGDTDACLSWTTFSGAMFMCCDSVRTVPTQGHPGGGCSPVIGSPMPPPEVFGTLLPFLAVVVFLGALRSRRGRRRVASI